jgi:hypothetical protein
MSQHDRDFDELLRRVLREEAGAVEPAGDGLERIRARLTRPRSVPVAWVMAVFSGAWRRVQGAALSASAWLRMLADGTSARVRPPRGGRPWRWQGRLSGWLGAGPRRWRSPAVLAAAGVVAVVASVLALTPLPQQAVSGTAALFRSLGGAHGSGGPGQGGGLADGGSGGHPAPGTTSSSPPGKQAHRSPSASPSPSAVPNPTASSGSGGSSPAASPSPTPSASSSPCPSPSASPSPGSTPSPGSASCPPPTPTPTTGSTTGPTTDPSAGSTPNPAP